MPAIIKGTLEALRQDFSESYNPTTGFTQESEFHGFGREQMLAKAQEAALNGCQYSYSERFGLYTLRIVDTRGEITIDSWDMPEVGLCPSLLEHPTVLGILERSGDRAAVVRGIKQALEGAEDYADITDLDPVTDGADTTNLRAFLDLMRNDVRTYDDSTYVLRHTTNVGNRYDVNIADNNVKRIYTTAQLLSEVQSTLLWTFPLPGRLVYKIENLPVPDARTNYLVGWYKTASDESTAANNRVNIVTNYQYGQHSTLLYEPAS